MAQIPNEAGLVTRSQIRGQNIPEVVTVDAQSPFQVLDAVRISDTQIQADIRYNGGSNVGDKRYVSVSSGEVSFKLQDALEVAPAQPFILTIDAIDPTSIIADGNGFPCTISGTGFSEDCVVSISGSGVTFNLVSATATTLTGTLTASIGAAQTIRNVTVARDGQSVTLNSALTILPIPVALTVTGIAPNTLPQNTTRNYTITGTGFVSGAAVTISGTGVTVNSTTFVNSTQLTANITVSAGATVGARNITVTNPNLTSNTLNSGASVTVDTTIYIDAAWLAANGPAPYFLNVEGATYVLETDVEVEGTAFYCVKRNVTFNLNGHEIRYNSGGTANKWGVCLYHPTTNTEIPLVTGWQTCTNFYCHSGSIASQAAGDRSHAIFGRHSENTRWENLDVLAIGKDAYAIHFSWPTTTTLEHNYFEVISSETFNRHSGPACVRLNARVTARYNILKGGNSGFTAGPNSVIEKNIIRHAGYVTNGYGGWFYRTNNVTFSDNIVIPSNGRGILANAGENHLFENNVILHLEAPNAEFGSGLNPPAMRCRYDAFNITYRNNTSLGIAGADGSLTSASSIYLTNYDGSPCNFSNNHCTVILIGTPTSSRYAQPITLESQGKPDQPAQDIIDNNILRSNETMIRTGGWDGRSFQERPMVGNEFQWVNGNTARTDFIGVLSLKLSQLEPDFLPHRYLQAQNVVQEATDQINALLTDVPLQPIRQFWWALYSEGTDFIYATISNSSFGANVNPETIGFSALRSNPVSLRHATQLNYQLMDGLNPVANATVIAVNDQGDQFTLQSDENGFVSVPIVEYAMDKPLGTGQPFSKIARAVTTLTVDGYDPWILTHSEL